jgi:hypothetical protein
VVENNKSSGSFQGALFEDDGPVTSNSNKVSGGIPGVSAPTTYPPEGVKFLADDVGTPGSCAGAHPNQDASSNIFTGYAGIGLDVQSGYVNEPTAPDQPGGTLSGTFTSYSFELGACAGAEGILLTDPTGTSDLTATVTHAKGTVTSPDTGTSEIAGGG